MRFAPLLVLLALVITGCGSADTVAPATPAVPATPVKAAKHVKRVPKATIVRRANAICRRFGARLKVMGTPTSPAELERAHRTLRSITRRLHRLGTPTHDRARWERLLSQYDAMTRHIDEMRAGLVSGSADTPTSARLLLRSAVRMSRRAHLFGAHACS